MQNGMDYITLEESKDELLGKVGTAQRDKYEEELRLYAIGAAIRETRKQQNLTQEELGRMVGVQKAQISRKQAIQVQAALIHVRVTRLIQLSLI